MNKIIISLGGSLICPKEIDIDFIGDFKNLIESYVINEKIQFIIVCGGGNLARTYQKSANLIFKLDNNSKDLLGIEATRINALLILSIFKVVMVLFLLQKS